MLCLHQEMDVTFRTVQLFAVEALIGPMSPHTQDVFVNIVNVL